MDVRVFDTGAMWNQSVKDKTKIIKNKAISMMHGKSPRSDVEMSKTLNFVAAILDF